MKKSATPAALGLALALPTALCWYYDVYVHWQPKIYPFTVIAVMLGCAALTLLLLRVRGEKPKALAWKTVLSTAIFTAALFLPSSLINNVMHMGAKLAANIAVPLAAAQLLALFILLRKKLRKPVIAVCLAVSSLLSFTFMIGVPYYMDNLYKAPTPVLPEGQFAPMPALGEVDFTVPADGSIEEVRDLIREARAGGEDKPFTVLIEDGEYPVKQILFDERDHDTTYRSRDGGVTLSGGMRLEPKDFAPWDKNANIQVIDLTKLGLGPDDWGGLYAYGAYNSAEKYDNGVGPLPCELYVDGVRCTVARYPNEGWLRIGEVSDIGDYNGSNGNSIMVQTGWADMRNPRGGAFAMDEATAKRVQGWADSGDIWIFGCYKYDWADASTRVKAFDKAAGSLTTEQAHVYGYAEGGTYYFYNVLDELDAPGEWYLDRESGLLYVWPQGDFKDIVLTLNTETLITGENVKNLSFIGLTLQGTRGDGIALSGDNILVDHCTVQNLAGSAMSLTGYNNTASNNEICHVGRQGIIIGGGGAETLTPGNSRAINNLVHDWSEIVMTYQGGIRVNGTGNLAANNELYNARHTAIFFSGNNHVIERNNIHDVCLETSDAGAIYFGRTWFGAWGTVIRNNAIYNLGGNGHTPDGIYLDDGLSGVTVENNLLVNVPGLALHFSGRDIEAHGNIVVNAGRPVSYDERTRLSALGTSTWYFHAVEGGPQWQALFDSPWQTDIWRAAFPKLAAYKTDFADIEDPGFAANPGNSSVTGNVFVGPNKPRYDESVLRFSEIGPNEEYGFAQKYWTLSGYAEIGAEQVGRVDGGDARVSYELGGHP